MELLLLLNGKSENLIKKHELNESDIDVVKIDEKDLIKVGFILKFIRMHDYSQVYFGCMEIELQRFILFMMAYLFISGKNGGVIDELGNYRKYSLSKFIFFSVPGLFFEAIAAGLIVLYNYIKLPIVRQLYKAPK